MTSEVFTAREHVELEQLGLSAQPEVEGEEDELESLVGVELEADEHDLARVDRAVSQVDLNRNEFTMLFVLLFL